MLPGLQCVLTPVLVSLCAVFGDHGVLGCRLSDRVVIDNMGGDAPGKG